MKRAVAYGLGLLVLGAFGADILHGFFEYIDEKASLVLSTPHGLLILPVSLFVPENLLYFSNTVVPAGHTNAWEKWIYAVSPHLAMIFIFHLTAMFVFMFSRRRELERAYLVFTFVISFYILFFFDSVTAHDYTGAFYAVSLLINIPFLHLLRCIFGLRFHPKLYGGLAVALGAVLFVFYPTNYAEEVRFVICMGTSQAIVLFYCVFLLVRDIIKPAEQSVIERPIIRTILAVTLIITIALPALSFLLLPFIKIPIDISLNALFFIPSIFPIILFIVSLRFGILHFEVPIQGWFIRFIYFIFFSCVYWFSMGYHISRIQYYDEQVVLHIAAAVAFLLILDPMRTIAYIYVNRYFLNRRLLFRRYISQTANAVSNPKQILPFLQNFNKTLSEGLGIPRASVIFSQGAFSEWHVADPQILFVADDHPMWTQIDSRNRSGQYAVFTHTTPGPVRDMLRAHESFMLIAFQKFKVAILVPPKLNHEPFLSEDVSYLRTLLQLSEPLMENYKFLIATIHLKKQERELELAARIQRKFIPTRFDGKHIQFHSYFRPSQQVTGDYIDILEQNKERHSIFLGDVSGHGLGSAYLMAVIRSLIRGRLLVNRSNMEDVFAHLNEFLSEQYKGSDFMTLFGMSTQLVSARGGKNMLVEYINAGQHPAVVYLKSSKKLIRLERAQRVLGVIATDYKLEMWHTQESFRLFLYSDGAFEIWEKGGKMLGEKAVLTMIEKSIAMLAEEQLRFLTEKLMAKIPQKDDMDDLSLIVLDVDL